MSCQIHREQYSLSQSSLTHASQIRCSASPENSPQSQYNRSSSPDLALTQDVFNALKSMLDERLERVRDGTNDSERPSKQK